MIKSFLMLGQSNMAGRGFINEVPPIYNEHIKMLRNGRWQMMAEPVNYDRPTAGISPAVSFAAAWCREHPEDTIGLIPCAEGGSSIDEWAADGVLFRHAVGEAKYALQDSELAGVLWHQGENDSSNGKYKQYYRKLQQIIEALRAELNAPEIPVIIGGLGDYLGKSGFGTYSPEYDLVNQELQRFAVEQNSCYFVTAAGLTCNPDGIHIDAASQRIFGVRYYEAFSYGRHILTPFENEDELLKFIQEKPLTPAEKIFRLNMELGSGRLTYDEFETQAAQIVNEQE